MKKFFSKYYIHIIFVLYFIICFFRATKGFCWSDESFYFSTTDRFFKGDMPIRDEWWRTQMSSVFCLPFYAVFHQITGSSAGVILFFRLLYVWVSGGLAIVSYKIIRKDYPVSVSLSISTLIMFYAHLNITSFSYYMLSVIFLLLALLLIYDFYVTDSKAELIIAGFAYAISVLSLPSLALSYFAVVILAVLAIFACKVSKIPEKVRRTISSLKLPAILLYTFIGIMIPALVVLIYLLSNMTVSELLYSVPYVLTDNEHAFTIISAVKKFFTAVRDVYGYYTYISCILIVIALVFQKRLRNTVLADLLVCIDIFLFVVMSVKSYGHTGYIQTALTLFALPLFFLSSKKNYRLFWLFGVGGATLSMTYSISSNGMLYILAIGHFIIALAGICFAYDYVTSSASEVKSFKSISMMISLVVLYSCCVTFSLRMVNVYRDAPVDKLTYKITQGPAKGLYTTKEHLEYYNEVIDVIDEYCSSSTNNPDKLIMFSKILPWGYMYTDLKCAMPTSWRTNSYSPEQFEGYYNDGKHVMPSVILVLDEQYGSYDACGDVEDDHNPNLNELNDFWSDYIEQSDMTRTDVKCGVVYIKK